MTAQPITGSSLRAATSCIFIPPDYKQAPYKTINLFTSTVAPDSKIRFSPWKSILGGSQGYKASTFLRDEVRPYSSASNEKTAFSGNVGMGNRQSTITPQESNGFGAFVGKYLRSTQPVRFVAQISLANHLQGHRNSKPDIKTLGK